MPILCRRTRLVLGAWAAAWVCVLAAAGCSRPAPPRAAPAAPLDPDNERDAATSEALAERLGPVPRPRRAHRIGVVVKFLGNEYWKLLVDGMQSRAAEYGLRLDVQGAASESDRSGQASIMERMIEQGHAAILVSPQTDENLVPAFEKARKAGILVVNVDDAVLRDAEHFVGPLQYQNGVSAAQYLLQRFPEGGEVAVIEGQVGVYAARQRTSGFRATLAGSRLRLVASASGDWDLKKSLEVAGAILARHPDLRGIYCNNDIMALGAVEAVQHAGRLGQVVVIGTDGIGPAYDSIRRGELAATVDSFPLATGQVAVEVALRLLEGQAVPRVVFSPQALITRANADGRSPGAR